MTKAKTKFKIGDKVRVIDKRGIYPGTHLKNGEEYDVIGLSTDGLPMIDDKTGGFPLLIWDSELDAIELVKEDVSMPKQYRTEKRKARVGERILITDAEDTRYKNGQTMTVASEEGDGDVYAEFGNKRVAVLGREYEVIVEETPTTPSLEARVTELEAVIGELSEQVAALETQLADYDLKPKYRGIKLREEIAKTLNQAGENSRRADVIKQARAFVEDLLKEIDGHMGWGRTAIPLYSKSGRLRMEFVVNSEKRTVVALARLGNMPDVDRVYGKGIAKCAPDDVFNADIGKAIALARALGVKVPAEFLNAPKPDSVVVGMQVSGKRTSGYYRQSRTFTLTKPRNGGWAYSEDYPHSEHDWITKSDIGAIIDDTEAQY